jgi:hypothetical protein
MMENKTQTQQETQELNKKLEAQLTLLNLKEELKDDGVFRIELLRILEGIKEALEKK